jgi:hypothetical protein
MGGAMMTEPLPVISLSAETLSRTPPEAKDLIVLLLKQIVALQGQVAACKHELKRWKHNSTKTPPIQTNRRQAILLLT